MTDFTHHTPRLLSEADAAADLAGVARTSLPSVGTEDALIERLNDECDLCNNEGAEDIATLLAEAIGGIRALVSERDELASRVRELEWALWGCIAAIERTHHCTEADRLASAEVARAAISAKKGQP